MKHTTETFEEWHAALTKEKRLAFDCAIATHKALVASHMYNSARNMHKLAVETFGARVIEAIARGA